MACDSHQDPSNRQGYLEKHVALGGILQMLQRLWLETDDYPSRRGSTMEFEIRHAPAAVYLRKAIHRFADDYPKQLEAYQLTTYEWELAEILLVFLMHVERCTKRFECNHTDPEIGMLPLVEKADPDYVFFAYDALYNHIEDVKGALASDTGLGALPCAAHLLGGLEGMEKSLKDYYTATTFPTLRRRHDPQSSMQTFDLLNNTWDPEDSEPYINGCRERFMQLLYGPCIW